MSSELHSVQPPRLRTRWDLRICAALAFLCIASRHIQGQTTPSPVNLALNPSRSGYPNPLESNKGWGGGAEQWEILDGIRGYPDTYAHGLAFTGGHQTPDGGPPYVEPAGVRQATINFGASKTFNTVVIWHHGVSYTAQAPWLDYWDGSAWKRITLTSHVYPADSVEGQGYAHAELFSFAPVTGSKVRYSMDNSFYNVLGSFNVHGWINEFEVYNVAPPSCKIQPSKSTFVNGDQLTTTLQIANPDTVQLPVEFKFSLNVPGGSTISLAHAGGPNDGNLVLPAGFDQTIGPITIATITSAFPRGTYSFSCRFVNPGTGGLLPSVVPTFSGTVVPFNVQ